MRLIEVFIFFIGLFLQQSWVVYSKPQYVKHFWVRSGQDGSELVGVEGTRRSLHESESIQIYFEHEGETYQSHLERHEGSITATTMTIAVGDTKTTKTVPETFAYRSLEKDWLLTLRSSDSFEGLHYADDGRALYFKHQNGRFLVDDKAHDFFKNSQFQLPQMSSTGIGRKLAIDYWTNCYSGQGQVNTFTIGIAIAAKMSNTLGGNDTKIVNMINTMVTLSNEVYLPQMDIQLVVGDVYIQKGDGNPEWSSEGCKLNINRQLDGLQNWADRPSKQGLWHLIDDCWLSFRPTIGLAKIDALCRNETNVGVTYYFEEDSAGESVRYAKDYPTWATVAHELGHNFGAYHSFEDGQGKTGGIMDYGPINEKLIDGDIQFNTKYRKREVCAEISRVFGTCSAFGVSGTKNPTPAPTPQPTNAPVNSSGVSDVQLADCKLYNNALFYPRGADLHPGSYDDWTKESCFRFCKETPGCRSFMVREATRYCELWSDIRDKTNIFNWWFGGYKTYICPFTSVKDPVTPRRETRKLTCKKHRNMAIAGVADVYEGSYTAFWTVTECQRACALSEECKSFTFSETRNFCELWSVKSDTSLVSAPFFDTYFCAPEGEDVVVTFETVDDVVTRFDSNELAAECCSTYDDSYFFDANLFISETLTQEQCQKQCIGISSCTGFTFQEPTNRCELFEGKTATDLETSVSYKASLCDRECIASIVMDNDTLQGSSLDNIAAGAIGAVVGIFFVGAIAITGFAYSRNKGSKIVIKDIEATFDAETPKRKPSL